MEKTGLLPRIMNNYGKLCRRHKKTRPRPGLNIAAGGTAEELRIQYRSFFLLRPKEGGFPINFFQLMLLAYTMAQ